MAEKPAAKESSCGVGRRAGACTCSMETLREGILEQQARGGAEPHAVRTQGRQAEPIGHGSDMAKIHMDLSGPCPTVKDWPVHSRIIGSGL